MSSRIAAIALAVVASLGLAGCQNTSDSIFGAQGGGKTEYAFAPEQRTKLPAFGGPSLTDQSQNLMVSQYSGKIVLINFWGSWCSGCRLEAADLEKAWVSLSAKTVPVQFLGVNVRDTVSAGQSYLQDEKVTYPSVFDPALRTMLALRGYPASSIPGSILLDRQGRVAYIWLRPVAEKEIESAVTALAAEV